MNRHCATICLKETPTKPAAYYMNKMGPVDGPDSKEFWACFEVCCVFLVVRFFIMETFSISAARGRLWSCAPDCAPDVPQGRPSDDDFLIYCSTFTAKRFLSDKRKLQKFKFFFILFQRGFNTKNVVKCDSPCVLSFLVNLRIIYKFWRQILN